MADFLMIAAPLATHKTDIALKIHMVEGGRSDIKEYKTFFHLK